MSLPIYASTGQKIWYYSFRVICGLIFFFLIAPIITIIPLSFNAEDFFTFTPEMLSFDPEGYSLKHYRDFFTSPDWQQALWNSVAIAPVATLLSVSFGTLAAIGLSSEHVPFRRAIMAIRDNELTTASLGISTANYIVLTFVWSGSVVGIAGAMFAASTERVFPESFGLTEVIVHFAMVMVGGAGSLIGSVIGGAVLTVLPEYFRQFPGMEELFFGAIIIAVLLFLPKGLASLLAKVSPLFHERYYRE